MSCCRTSRNQIQHRLILIKNNIMENLLVWINERIAEIEAEYDLAQKKSYGTGLEYDSNAQSILISKGGKLKGYKEVRDYINSHS